MPEPPSTPTVRSLIEDSIRSTVLSRAFPCLGAKSALNNDTYELWVYDRMGGERETRELALHLASYARKIEQSGDRELWSFIAAFTEPAGVDAQTFERDLWAQLRALHALDTAPWAPGFSSVPTDPAFAFSFAGTAFFIAGMHAGSPRWSRRTAWPMLVFNAHSQFDKLDLKGSFKRFSDLIVARDTAIQGTAPHLVVSYGDQTEAPHYASCADDIASWRCPLGPTPFN